MIGKILYNDDIIKGDSVKIIDIIEKVAKTSSRNEKEAIFRMYSDNVVLREVCRLALDSHINYYIRKIPSYEPNYTGKDLYELDDALKGLKKIYTRELTGHAAINHFKNLLERVSPRDAKVLELIISKDLKCGASEATINKIWPNLVKTWPIMLCEPSSDKLLAKMQYPAYCQLKLDGMRANVIVDKNGNVSIHSRNGKVIDLLGSFDNDAQVFASCTEYSGLPVVIDGEFIVVKDGKILPRKTGNGIIMKGIKGTITKEEADSIHMIVWDVIPYDNWKTGHYNKVYMDRFSNVSKALTQYGVGRIRVVDNVVVNNYEEAYNVFEQYLLVGEEGVILKNVTGIWEDKRVQTQLKLKNELQCELRVTGWKEGTGKYTGQVGSLQMASEDGVINVNISWFTDDFRSKLKPEEFMNKIATVQYNSRIVDKNGNNSLFIPGFIEWREDKDQADFEKDIKW